MTILILVVLLLVISSALCSGSEAALFSITMIKVRQLVELKKRGAQALLTIQENMGRPIAAIVILNNIANIVGSIVVGNIAAEVLGSQWLGVFSGVLTFTVIIFAEIIPKNIGERYAESIALLVAPPVLFITRLLTPVVWLVEVIVSPFTKNSTQYTTNEAEIRLLTKIGHTEGVIELDESEMIQKVFELNDLTAADLMTPRVAMTYLKGALTLKECKDAIINSPHSRFVVVDETPDEIRGVALKDELLIALITSKENNSVDTFTKKILHVYETTYADTLIPLFQKEKQHLAIVTDAYGGVSGVITLEDVLEVLTGQIVDETDKVSDLQDFTSKNNPYKKKK